MPKPIVFIAALLLALSASAQTLMPARQVSVPSSRRTIRIGCPGPSGTIWNKTHPPKRSTWK